MYATEALKEEHRVIERIVKVLTLRVERLEKGEEPLEFEEVLDLIRNFADKYHHGKEESVLFPALEKHGIPKHRGPIGLMLEEHKRGKGFVKALGEAVRGYEKGNRGMRESIVQNANGYIQLITQHIRKEDNILFQMADRVLSEQEQKKVLEGFEDIEKEEMGEGRHL